MQEERKSGPMAVVAIRVDFRCYDDTWLRSTGVMICDIKEEENCREQTHDDNWTVKRLEDTCVLEDMIITL